MLGSSFPGKLTVMTVHPSNGMMSPFTAHTSNLSALPMSSARGLTSTSGKFLSFHAQSIMLTWAPLSSRALTARPFKLHWVRAFFLMSLKMGSCENVLICPCFSPSGLTSQEHLSCDWDECGVVPVPCVSCGILWPGVLPPHKWNNVYSLAVPSWHTLDSHGVFLLSVTLAYSQNTHSFAQVLMAFIKAEAFIKSTMLVSASILVSCLMESFLLVCSATSFTVLISAKGPLSSWAQLARLGFEWPTGPSLLNL